MQNIYRSDCQSLVEPTYGWQNSSRRSHCPQQLQRERNREKLNLWLQPAKQTNTEIGQKHQSDYGQSKLNSGLQAMGGEPQQNPRRLRPPN
jgi:hypothetical protein